MDLTRLTRETYAVINLDYLEENYKLLKEAVGSGVEIACVIKADAYGHGSVEVARTLIGCGVNFLAVACLSEALVLRKFFEDVAILVMGNIPDEHVKVALENNIRMTVYAMDQGQIIADVAKALGKKALVHIKYDTGFNRLGFEDKLESLGQIKTLYDVESIEIEGLFSHLALIDKEGDCKQYERLIDVYKTFNSMGCTFKFCHICDSIASIRYPDFRLNMVRPGAILYGLKSESGEGPEVKQVMTLHTRISRVHWIKSGGQVSYGGFTAKRDTLIATLPIGYADGYPRNMANRSKVMIDGNLYPLVGITCMDQCMVDVTGSEDLKRGDAVTIYSDEPDSGISIADIAAWGETNKNEIVSRLSKRVPKVYIKNGHVVRIVDDSLEMRI